MLQLLFEDACTSICEGAFKPLLGNHLLLVMTLLFLSCLKWRAVVFWKHPRNLTTSLSLQIIWRLSTLFEFEHIISRQSWFEHFLDFGQVEFLVLLLLLLLMSCVFLLSLKYASAFHNGQFWVFSNCNRIWNSLFHLLFPTLALGEIGCFISSGTTQVLILVLLSLHHVGRGCYLGGTIDS